MGQDTKKMDELPLVKVADEVVALWDGHGTRWTGRGWLSATDETHVMLFTAWGDFEGEDEGVVAGRFWQDATFMPWKQGAWMERLLAMARAELEKDERDFAKAKREWSCENFEDRFIRVTCPDCGEEFWVDDYGKRVDPEKEWMDEKPMRRSHRRRVAARVGAERKLVILDALLLAKAIESAPAIGGVISVGLADVKSGKDRYEVFYLSGGCWRFAILPATLQEVSWGGEGNVDAVDVEWEAPDGAGAAKPGQAAAAAEGQRKD